MYEIHEADSEGSSSKIPEQTNEGMPLPKAALCSSAKSSDSGYQTDIASHKGSGWLDEEPMPADWGMTVSSRSLTVMDQHIWKIEDTSDGES